MPASRPLRPPARASTLRRSPLLLSALAGLLAACGPTGRPAPEPPPDLVLISLDTFRADLLEMAREDGSPELPTLRRLADESIWFTNAWAPRPFTLSSHMTMLTGLHPETHAVNEKESKLAEAVPTLAELLGRAHYVSAGVGCGPWLERRHGFERGFEVYRNLKLDLHFAPRVRANALQALSGLPPERPRFLFAHFYDAHGDLEKHGNKLSYYAPPAHLHDLDPPESAICSASGQCGMRFLMLLDSQDSPPATGLAAIHFELYRRGARFLDDELRLFFDQLRDVGLWDDAVVVVTADHGEEFLEHGRFLHTQIFRESLRVPLLVRLPRAERGGEHVSRPVTLEDIAPTLLTLAGVPAPAEMHGFDLLRPPRSGSARPILGREIRLKDRFALRLGDRLFVRDTVHGERRVFDLAADPEEKREIVANAAELARLDERLDATLRRLRAGRRTAKIKGLALDDQEAADLRALGYLQ